MVIEPPAATAPVVVKLIVYFASALAVFGIVTTLGVPVMAVVITYAELVAAMLSSEVATVRVFDPPAGFVTPVITTLTAPIGTAMCVVKVTLPGLTVGATLEAVPLTL